MIIPMSHISVTFLSFLYIIFIFYYFNPFTFGTTATVFSLLASGPWLVQCNPFILFYFYYFYFIIIIYCYPVIHLFCYCWEIIFVCRILSTQWLPSDPSVLRLVAKQFKINLSLLCSTISMTCLIIQMWYSPLWLKSFTFFLFVWRT